MFIDSRNRRLGDLAAGTLVVSESTIKPPVARESPGSSGLDDPALRTVVARMTSDEYRLVTRFLSRRESLDPEHRGKLVDDIVRRIFGKNEIPRGSLVARERLLEKVEALYRQRLRVL